MTIFVTINPRPPEWEHRRCQGKHWSGRQCNKWAVRGTNYCKSHKRGAQPKSTRIQASARSLLQRLPVFYSRVLGKTLKSRLKESLEQPVHEQLAAYEELALIREQCSNIVALYSAAVEQNVSHEAIIAAGEIMKDACAFVIEQCARIQQMENSSKDKISIHNITLISAQMTRIMYRVCGEEHMSIAQEFERLCKEEVRLPRSAAEGTSITPDMDVLEMDDTIPPLPGIESELDESI